MQAKVLFPYLQEVNIALRPEFRWRQAKAHIVFKIHFNIILPSTSGSAKWTLFFMPFRRDSACIPLLFHGFYVLRQSQSSNFDLSGIRPNYIFFPFSCYFLNCRSKYTSYLRLYEYYTSVNPLSVNRCISCWSHSCQLASVSRVINKDRHTNLEAVRMNNSDKLSCVKCIVTHERKFRRRASTLPL